MVNRRLLPLRLHLLLHLYLLQHQCLRLRLLFCLPLCDAHLSSYCNTILFLWYATYFDFDLSLARLLDLNTMFSLWFHYVSNSNT